MMWAENEGKMLETWAEEELKKDGVLSSEKRNLEKKERKKRSLMLKNIDVDDVVNAMMWAENEGKMLETWAEEELKKEGVLSSEKKNLEVLKRSRGQEKKERKKRDLSLPNINVEEIVNAVMWAEKEGKDLETWAEEELKKEGLFSLKKRKEKLSLKKRDAKLAKRDTEFVDVLSWAEDNMGEIQAWAEEKINE